MRQKKQKIVFTFFTTEQAMAVESLSQTEEFPGRMIPVPPEVTSGCGLCWCCQPQEKKVVQEILCSFSLSVEAIYEVMLYETK